MILVHCDIDQTYLQTDFHSFRGLLRVVTEKASDKKTFPYAQETLEILSNKEDVRLRFLSASPEQMRRVLQKKIRLDGVSFDEVFLKDATSMVLSGSLRGVLNQVSYKLPVLLQSFLQCLQKHPQQTYHQLLFGDDSEDDPIIYTIFEAIVQKKISHNSPILSKILDYCSISEGSIQEIQQLSRNIQEREYQTRIVAIIHMTTNGPMKPLLVFPQFVIPVFNWLQIALFIHAIDIFSTEDLRNITKTTSSFSIQGNREALERVCSKENVHSFIAIPGKNMNDNEDNREQIPNYQRQEHSIFDIIQLWRKR
jgi:hypothetical protein